MQASLFKRSSVRGINDALINAGLQYPSKTAADEVADAVADEMMVTEPAMEGAEGEIPAEEAAEIATKLVEVANELMASTQPAPDAPEEERIAAYHGVMGSKTAAARDVNTRAGEQSYACMQKAAEEADTNVSGAGGTGSTIGVGAAAPENTLPNATFAETQMEASQRPPGTHEVGVGNTEQAHAGVVGSEDVGADTPAPHTTAGGAGTNSVIEHSEKNSTLRQIIQKVAAGSNIEGGDKPENTLPNAPAAETQMENSQRPPGYAALPQLGGTVTDIGTSPAATVGTEQPVDAGPQNTPAGAVPGSAGNSVVEHSETSMPGKTAGVDPAYLHLFQKTANHVVDFLPSQYTENDKVAQVRYMMGLNDGERSAHISSLHKHAGTMDAQSIVDMYSIYADKVAEEEAAAAGAPPPAPKAEKGDWMDRMSKTTDGAYDWANAKAHDVKTWVQKKLKKDPKPAKPAAPAAAPAK
jgi:hypothetical protein